MLYYLIFAARSVNSQTYHLFMPLTIDQLLLLVSTLLFAGNFGLVLWMVKTNRYRDSRVGLLVVSFGFVVQMALLWVRGEAHGRCPITNSGEVLVFLAWAMIIWYLLFGSSYRLSLLGMCTMPLVVLLQVLAMLPGVYQTLPSEPVKQVSAVVELHAATAIMAYGAFGLAAVAAGMFLLQNRHLKLHQTSPTFFVLPPITKLFTTLMRLLIIGVLLLAVSLGVSYLAPTPVPGDKLAIGYAVLILYVLLLGCRKVLGISQSAMAWIVMGLFVLAAGSIGFMTV